jgi:mono/diheme cytochrome c family protein
VVSGWASPLLAALEGLQRGVLTVLHAVGAAPDLHGQPAWPFAERIAADTLRIDLGLARQVGWSLLAIGVATLLALLALAWRRRRPWLLAAAALLTAVAPWPSPALVFTRADPTSFHVAPVVSAQDIVGRGRTLYDQHCAACHGADGRSETPLAATLPMWPPDLTRGLLWQRSDGDLFWRIRHGLHDDAGAQTMPPLAGPLTDADEWALLAFTQALAAGTSLRRTGSWATPVRVPAIDVTCADGHQRRLDVGSTIGMRRRIVALDAGDPAPLPDPRFETIVLASGTADLDMAPADCITHSPAASQLLALIAGTSTDELRGTRLIADRRGWLRAVSRPGAASWSDADLVCRVGDRPSADRASAPDAVSIDGLTRLVDAMDREPVDPTRGGFIH